MVLTSKNDGQLGVVPRAGKALTTTTLIQLLCRYGARNAVSADSIGWGASSRQ